MLPRPSYDLLASVQRTRPFLCLGCLFRVGIVLAKYLIISTAYLTFRSHSEAWPMGHFYFLTIRQKKNMLRTRIATSILSNWGNGHAHHDDLLVPASSPHLECVKIPPWTSRSLLTRRRETVGSPHSVQYPAYYDIQGSSTVPDLQLYTSSRGGNKYHNPSTPHSTHSVPLPPLDSRPLLLDEGHDGSTKGKPWSNTA